MGAREWLESLKQRGMNLDLGTTASALVRLSLPQHDFPAIHVAGSNGKGTVCAILSNAFTMSGVRCGLFTSPHLCRVEERIRVDGVPISRKELDDALDAISAACKRDPPLYPTFYEVTFLAAIFHFSSTGVERAIIETGLGGRHDATRLVEADCCLLTQISLEHSEILGDTLGKIAAEKAAIARPERPLVALWSYDKEVREEIESAVSSSKLGWWWRPDRATSLRFDESDEPHRSLPDIVEEGHQAGEEFNGWTTMLEDATDLALVTAGVLEIAPPLFPFIQKSKIATRWPGRMQWLTAETGQRVLLDSAHNPSGISRALKEITVLAEKNQGIIPRVMLLGCTSQTDFPAFIHPIIEYIVEAEVSAVVVTQPQGGRTLGLDVEILAGALTEQIPELSLHLEEDPPTAFDLATTLVEGDDALLCIGSLYLAGNILTHLEMDDDDSLTILGMLEEDMV